MARPTRHAALNARWLIHDTQNLVRSSPSTTHLTSAFDSDDDDDSYLPSSSKRQRTSAPALAPSPPSPLPPASAFTADASAPTPSDDFDLWDEAPTDPRHQRTRTTGCYVVSPLYRVPPPYLDLRQAEAAAASGVPGAANVLLASGVASGAPCEPLASLQARDRALTSALSTLQATFARATASVHSGAFAAIRRWVGDALPAGDRWSLGSRVPTALLYCGVDVDDHPLLFAQLSAHLIQPAGRGEEGVRCLPVQLVASAGGSVEKVVQQLLLSLITTYPTSTAAPAVSLRSQSSSHFLHSHQQHAARQKHLAKDLWAHFAQWWEDTQAEATAPLRLLLLVTEPHAFDAAVLTGVLYALLNHPTLSRLPWCWVLALTVDGRVLRGVGERVVSRMRVTAFHLQSSASLLQPVMRALMMRPEAGWPLPVLGGGVLSWLMRDYAKAHTSLASWSRVLRTIACAYYGNVEYSHLTQAWREGKGKDAVAQLTAEELAELRRLVGEDGVGSAAVAGRGKRKLTFSDAEYREKLMQWMEGFDAAREAFLLAIRVLDAVSEELVPSRATADSMLIDAHLLLSQSGRVETFPPLVDVLQGVRSQPSSAVARALQAMKSTMEASDLSTEAEEVTAVIEQLQAGEAAAQQVAATRTASKPVKASGASSRRQAQLGGVVQADKAREAVRAKVASFLSAFFASRLVPLTALPLSSLFVFESKELPSMFAFDQQAAVTSAISEAAPAGSRLTAESDDLAVVFRLYEEASGVQLELYSWFQSFCSVIAQRRGEEEGEEEKREDEDESSDRRKGKARNRRRSGSRPSQEDEGDFLASLGERQLHELFARFVVSVNALRWCGFVKPAAGKRSREEMVRLVWDH